MGKIKELEGKIKELELFENTWVGHLYDEAQDGEKASSRYMMKHRKNYMMKHRNGEKASSRMQKLPHIQQIYSDLAYVGYMLYRWVSE